MIYLLIANFKSIKKLTLNLYILGDNMITNELFKIKGNFYRQERVRPKEKSIHILPKQVKMTKNAQIELVFTESNLPIHTILYGIHYLLEEWEIIFNDYSIFRIFYDNLPNNSIKFLISFNTSFRLSYVEGDTILKTSFEILENSFKNKIETKHDDTTFIDFMDNELDKQDNLLHSLLNNDEIITQTSEKITTLSPITLEHQLDYDIPLTNEKETLFIQINHLQDSLVKANKEIELLTNLKKNTNKMSTDFQNTIDKTKEDLYQQITLNNNNLNVINDLRNNLDIKNQNIKTKDNKIDNLQAKLNIANKEIIFQNEINDNHFSDINELQIKLSDSNNEIQSKNGIIHSNSNTIKELQHKLDKANKEVISKNETNNNVSDTLIDVQIKLDDSHKELETKNEIIENYSITIKELQNKLDEASKEIISKNETNNNNTTTINDLQAKFDNAHKELNTKNEIINNHSITIKELQNKLDKANKDIISKNETNDNISATLNGLQVKLDDSFKELETKNEIIENYSITIKELQNKLDETNKDNISKNEINDNTLATINGLQIKLNGSFKELETKNEIIENYSITIKELQNKLDETNKDNISKNEVNDHFSDTINGLQIKLDDSFKELKAKNELITNYSIVINQLQNKLKHSSKNKPHNDINEKNSIISNKLHENELLDNSLSSTPSTDKQNNTNNTNSSSFVSEKELVTTLKNISTNWEQLYHTSDSNYQQIKKQPIISKKTSYSANNKNRTQPTTLPNSDEENNRLTPSELNLLALFNNYDSSKHNNSVSIDSQKFKDYMTSLPFLSLTWQSIFKGDSKFHNRKLEQTFQPFIDELESVLEEISLATKPKLLSKKKVVLTIDDLKLLEAYDALYKYISNIKTY
jgi:hypothetical protein